MLHHLNIHPNADAELRLSPHTANTHLADSSQLGLGGAARLFCTDSSFHWVRRDKAASSFFYYTHLRPLDCEKSFNAVPLRERRKNSLKKVHSLANSHGVTFQSQCEWPLKEQRSYLNKSPFWCFFGGCIKSSFTYSVSNSLCSIFLKWRKLKIKPP